MALYGRNLAAVLIALLLAGCAGGGPSATPTATPTPAEISARIGRATQASKSLQFQIDLTGAPVYSDSSHLFVITNIIGAIQPPDGALATLQVKSALGVAEIRTVSAGGKQYFTNPVSRQWQCLASGSAFDPAVLFDPARGIGALLQQGMEQIEFVGLESLDGAQVYHLRGILPAERTQPISAGLLGAGPVRADLWADTDTARARKLVLVDSATNAEQPTTWTLTFGQYDQPVEVKAPVAC
jgi:lipoprotein LprG